ncbi:MAG: hypothetical protein R6U27_07585 [Desulfobacterales bacterium]
MSFKEKLLRKIRIDKLASQVISSIGPADSDKKMDKQAMRTLLEMGPYKTQKERDLELYIKKNGSGDKKRILVLDNDLPIYQTDISDVALRKSPTVKEMVNIRNIIKILNDSDVVKSKKEESVRIVQKECIQQLDLHYTESDIDQIKDDGKVSLEMKDTEGVLEVLEIFAELLGFDSPPKVFHISDFNMLGKISKNEKGETFYGPIVLYSLYDNELKLIDKKIGSFDKAGIELIHQIATGNEKASKENFEVFEYLKNEVFKQ